MHKYKNTILNLEEKLIKVYENILKAANNSMWKEVIILTRIIIMHIAVIEKTEKGKNFKYYIEYLDSQRLLKRSIINLLEFGRDWGNNLNHIVEEFQNKNEKNGKLCLEIVGDVLSNLYKYKDFNKETK